jgi:hypothetical protein
MKVVSKTAMVVAWAHVVWMTAGFAVPATAHAQSAPPPDAVTKTAETGGDVIELKTGGLLRGTLIDAIPNGHARIQLVTGEVATVPWQDIAHIERASGPAPAPAAPVPAAPAEATVYVHITGSDGAELQRDTGDRRKWDVVCTAPCDVAVPAKETYRIGGAGIRNSRPFNLGDDGGKRRTLYVDEASKGSFALGIVGLSVGALTAMVGVLIIAVDAAVSDLDGQNGNNSNDGATAGGITVAVGVGLIIGGAVLLGGNVRTGVSQTPPSTSGDATVLGPSIALGGRALSPVLREAPAQRLAPPVTSVPIFSARF